MSLLAAGIGSKDGEREDVLVVGVTILVGIAVSEWLRILDEDGAFSH